MPLDRQRQANNPDNYYPDRWEQNANGKWRRKKGQIKPGRQRWVVSNRMRANLDRLSDLQHRLAAHRKSLHGQMINRILTMGTSIKTEKLSYKSLQRNYGKSVGTRALGMFVSHLNRKAASAGGGMDEFSTYHTRLSQVYLCGTIQKKPLAQRWHNCACGICQQRDLFSAFFARCVKDDRLVVSMAQSSYAEIDNTLWVAASCNESVIGQRSPPTFQAGSQNGSPANVMDCVGKAHGVGYLPPTMREPATSRTPRLKPWALSVGCQCHLVRPKCVERSTSLKLMTLTWTYQTIRISQIVTVWKLIYN